MRTKSAGLWALFLGAALLSTASTVADDARACGGEWVPEIDWRVPGIQNAERQIDKGKPNAAGGAILRMIPNIKSYRPTTSGLIGRNLRTLAVALVRTNGALDVGKQLPKELHATWLGKSDADRKQNLEWAVATLRGQAKAKKDDPAVLSDLGEALAKLDGGRDEAVKLLGDLAEKDLIATPQAYSALARLRGDAGDAEGSKLALKRCEAMAKAANLCSAGARS